MATLFHSWLVDAVGDPVIVAQYEALAARDDLTTEEEVYLHSLREWIACAARHSLKQEVM